MKKYILPIIALMLVLLSVLSFVWLDTFNFPRAALGLGKLVSGRENVVQIGQWPKEVWLSADYQSYETHLAADGWDLLECERLGALIPAEKGGQQRIVRWSVHDLFDKWVWDEKAVIDRPIETAPPVKPILYLYPETVTEVEVKLDYDGELSCVYPEYHDGWRVTAHPDGTLYDENGQEYYCLYWEGSAQSWTMDEGFCVAGADTAAFLEDALADLGLNRREANEFIVYWLPLMEDNAWNLISFQGAAYTDTAKLAISPAPDTLIRVFMTFKSLDAPVEIAPQTLTAPERTGFTVVEWGGGLIE